MRRRRYKTRGEAVEASFELDLAPMLALMVTLIPIILLSTVFVKIMVIDTQLPQVVEKIMKEEEKNPAKKVKVALYMEANGSFKLVVQRGSQTLKTKNLVSQEGKWDFESLHSVLADTKRQHPNTFRLELHPSNGVPYSEIVKAMDEARQFTVDEGKVTVTHAETGEAAETQLMFPNVVFTNVVGG
jgi:biopolymer transport protein ExbD